MPPFFELRPKKSPIAEVKATGLFDTLANSFNEGCKQSQIALYPIVKIPDWEETYP
jgi:hypothetical protein